MSVMTTEIAGVRELTLDEIELVGGAIDWGAVWNSAMIGGYSGLAAGATGGGLWWRWPLVALLHRRSLSVLFRPAPPVW